MRDEATLPGLAPKADEEPNPDDDAAAAAVPPNAEPEVPEPKPVEVVFAAPNRPPAPLEAAGEVPNGVEVLLPNKFSAEK